MRTGLGVSKRIRNLHIVYNIFRFWWRKTFLGFDVANQFIQRIDKNSLQQILKRNGANIGKNCDIETGLVFHNCSDYTNLIIGNNCHIGKNCFFDLREKVNLSENVVVSMKCSFITHQDLQPSNLCSVYPSRKEMISISRHSYIGAGSIILMGVKIGENSVVGASSLINRSIEPNSIVAGVPGKFIKWV